MSSSVVFGEGQVGKLGVIYLGGAGEGILADNLRGLNPDEYPDFYHLGANTDVMSSRDKFGEQHAAVLEPWINKKMLSFHSIGNEVTGGYGSGALVEVGRRAAESAETIRVFREFMEPLSEVRIVGGAVGGTSGGAFPVVARIASEMKKSTLAIPIMPRRVERRDKLANKVLNEVRSYVPVLPIQNRFIEKTMYELPPEKQRTFDLEVDGYQMINRYSIIECLRTDREIIQVPGDLKNLDQADRRTAFSLGNTVFQGIVEFENAEKAMNATPEQIVAEALAGRCQNPDGYKNAESLIYWAHGPWPFYLIDKSQELLCNMVLGEDREEEGEVPRFHWGWRKHVTDGKMFIAIQVISRRGDSEVAKESSKVAISIPEVIRTERVLIDVKVDGADKTMRLWKDQAERYKTYYPDSSTPQSEILKLREDIKESHNVLIDLPTWMKEEDTSSASDSDNQLRPRVH